MIKNQIFSIFRGCDGIIPYEDMETKTKTESATKNEIYIVTYKGNVAGYAAYVKEDGFGWSHAGSCGADTGYSVVGVNIVSVSDTNFCRRGQ